MDNHATSVETKMQEGGGEARQQVLLIVINSILQI